MRTLSAWYKSALLNPRTRLWVILGSLIYLLSPIDLSPDIIPIAGQVDDVVVLVMLMSSLFQMVASQFSLEQARRLQGCYGAGS